MIPKNRTVVLSILKLEHQSTGERDYKSRFKNEKTTENYFVEFKNYIKTIALVHN